MVYARVEICKNALSQFQAKNHVIMQFMQKIMIFCDFSQFFAISCEKPHLLVIFCVFYLQLYGEYVINAIFENRKWQFYAIFMQVDKSPFLRLIACNKCAKNAIKLRKLRNAKIIAHA